MALRVVLAREDWTCLNVFADAFFCREPGGEILAIAAACLNDSADVLPDFGGVDFALVDNPGLVEWRRLGVVEEIDLVCSSERLEQCIQSLLASR